MRFIYIDTRCAGHWYNETWHDGCHPHGKNDR